MRIVRGLLSAAHAAAHELRQQERAAALGDAQELATVERQIAKLVQALKDGIPASVVRAELLELERRKGAFASRLAHRPEPLLHPNMAALYQAKVAELQDALTQPDSRPRAADLLRGVCR